MEGFTEWKRYLWGEEEPVTVYMLGGSFGVRYSDI